jgi:hypothetical protein
MPKTRPDGSPLTPNDPEFWNRPYTFQEFAKMLYRRQRAGMARRPVRATLQPEGVTQAPDGTVLKYLTVQSAAEEADAAAQGWADLTTTIARGASHHTKNLA